MILGASGENIYPEEIEALINKSAYVAESLVSAKAQGLTALVQLKQEVLDDLKAKAKDSLEDFERASEEAARECPQGSQLGPRGLQQGLEGGHPPRALRKDADAEDQALPLHAHGRKSRGCGQEVAMVRGQCGLRPAFPPRRLGQSGSYDTVIDEKSWSAESMPARPGRTVPSVPSTEPVPTGSSAASVLAPPRASPAW